MSELASKHCVPCEGNTPSLNHEENIKLLGEINGWTLLHDKAIEKLFTFKSFKEALAFVNNVGAVAEAEGHHPDINLFDYKNVRITLSTHAIDGLSDNDFILAAKIDGTLHRQ